MSDTCREKAIGEIDAALAVEDAPAEGLDGSIGVVYQLLDGEPKAAAARAIIEGTTTAEDGATAEMLRSQLKLVRQSLTMQQTIDRLEARVAELEAQLEVQPCPECDHWRERAERAEAALAHAKLTIQVVQSELSLPPDEREHDDTEEWIWTITGKALQKLEAANE